MDLICASGRLVAVAGNLAHLALHGGFADLRPTPRAVVAEEVRHRLLLADPVGSIPTDAAGDPVLLVPAPTTPVTCFDLRRGCSLVEHLVDTGRPAYLLEFGEVSLRDPDLGLDPWVADVLPAAIRATSDHAGGRPVHVVGWSLGGTLAMLAAAAHADLPITSLAVLGSPTDVAAVPLVAPDRPLLSATDWPDPIPRLSRTLPVTSVPPVSWVLALEVVRRLVTNPTAVALHLDDAEWLAQVEAVARFSATVTAYPGRTYGRLYHRFAAGNALAAGAVEVGGRTLRLADVAAPTIVVAGATDAIAPVAAVRAAVPLLTGTTEARLEIVPGGHLGLLTGRAARETTWPVLDDWFSQWDGGLVPPAAPLGTDPRRRHRSASSRALAR